MSEGEQALAKSEEAPTEGRKGSWLLGWVIGPGVVVLGILTAGAYVGANHPESWVTRLVNWTVGLF
jgi:hypothetical protein